MSVVGVFEETQERRKHLGEDVVQYMPFLNHLEENRFQLT